MKPISNLDEYIQVEKQADALYEKPHKQAELNALIEALSDYEDKHPEEVSKIYGDESNLPPEEDPFEDETDWQSWDYYPEDY